MSPLRRARSVDRAVAQYGRHIRQQIDLTLHHAEETPYESLDLRETVHPSWVFSFVKTGLVETWSTAAGARTAASGSVMIHPPMIPFSERAHGYGLHQWMALQVRDFAQIDIVSEAQMPIVVAIARPEEYSNRFTTLLGCWDTPSTAARDLRMASIVLDLLTGIVQDWRASPEFSTPASELAGEQRFADAIAFMEAHMAERVTREQLAARVFLHPGYFDRVFRARFGIPPMQMLREIRLRRAQQLLIDTSSTIETIAVVCGLGDAPQLSRIFRRRFHETPGDYRKRMRDASRSIYAPSSR